MIRLIDESQALKVSLDTSIFHYFHRLIVYVTAEHCAVKKSAYGCAEREILLCTKADTQSPRSALIMHATCTPYCT